MGTGDTGIDVMDKILLIWELIFLGGDGATVGKSSM